MWCCQGCRQPGRMVTPWHDLLSGLLTFRLQDVVLSGLWKARQHGGLSSPSDAVRAVDSQAGWGPQGSMWCCQGCRQSGRMVALRQHVVLSGLWSARQDGGPAAASSAVRAVDSQAGW